MNVEDAAMTSARAMISDPIERTWCQPNRVDGGREFRLRVAADRQTREHRIWVEWYNSGGQMGLNLFMKQKDGREIPIPAEMLFHE